MRPTVPLALLLLLPIAAASVPHPKLGARRDLSRGTRHRVDPHPTLSEQHDGLSRVRGGAVSGNEVATYGMATVLLLVNVHGALYPAEQLELYGAKAPGAMESAIHRVMAYSYLAIATSMLLNYKLGMSAKDAMVAACLVGIPQTIAANAAMEPFGIDKFVGGVFWVGILAALAYLVHSETVPPIVVPVLPILSGLGSYFFTDYTSEQYKVGALSTLSRTNMKLQGMSLIQCGAYLAAYCLYDQPKAMIAYLVTGLLLGTPWALLQWNKAAGLPSQTQAPWVVLLLVLLGFALKK